MYSVYRCENGRQTLVSTNILDLQQAFAKAAEFQSHVTSSDVQYRVRGPAQQRGSQKGSAFTSIMWYVPKSPVGQLDGRIPSNQGTPQAAQRPDSPTKHTTPSSAGPRIRKKSGTFSITRITPATRKQAGVGFLTLDAACERALELQSRDPDPKAQYIVLLPQEYQETPRPAPRAARIPPPPPTPAPRSVTAPPRQDSLPNRLGTPLNPTQPGINTVEERVYSVVSHVLGQKRVLVSNIRSREEAEARARDLRLRSRDSSEAILVHEKVHRNKVAPKPRRTHRRTPDVVANMNRPHVDPLSEQKRRKRFDPEIGDRRGDISLVMRTEEEIGLGIPAQWGKGRRHRKGEYIP